MLRGRFGNTTGRPYIEGRLILPRLNVESDVSWCVDTGADRSLLMPGDGERIGLDYTKFTRETESVGVGGISRDYLESAWLVFADPGRSLYAYALDLEISPPSSEITDLPSLLGRDVLHRWRMSYKFARKRLVFEVLSADVVIPISSVAVSPRADAGQVVH
jgi:hypothetical protein